MGGAHRRHDRGDVGGIVLARHWSIGAICSFMGLAGVLGAIAILLLKQTWLEVARRVQLSKAAAGVS